MMRELAEDLVQRGHRVTVLTSWPQYNLSAEARQRTFASDVMENGVRVLRIKTLPTHKVAYVLRGIAQVLLPQLFIRALHRYVRERVNAVVVYTPHLPLARVGAYVQRQYGARFLLNVQDIFPQNAIDLGILKNRQLIAYFERMECTAYAAADAITTHTPGSLRFLTERRRIPSEKVTLVPNWIDFRAWDAVRPTGAFRKRFGVEGKFVLLFAGILGPAQHLPFTIDVAKRVADLRDVHFLFVGDGTERRALEDRVRELDLRNVQFESFVDPAEYPALVKEMDVGLVTLGMAYTTSMVPGKVLGYMAAGIPMVAFLNAGNDGHEIIRAAACGVTAHADDPDRAALIIRQLYDHRTTLQSVGTNGRRYAEAHYGQQPCIDALERLLVQPVPLASPAVVR